MNEEEILNEIDFCLAGEYITMEHRQAIECLLDLYNQEKEKNKKLEEEKEAFEKGYEIARDEEVDNYFLMSKVIDMLIENIIEYHVPYDYCIAYGKNPNECDVLNDNEKCKECIKQYYFKKARGEENVKD